MKTLEKNYPRLTGRPAPKSGPQRVKRQTLTKLRCSCSVRLLVDSRFVRSSETLFPLMLFREFMLCHR